MAYRSNGNDGLGSQAEAVSAGASSFPRTEKEKMMAGELYDAFDPVLLAERNLAKHLCFQLNQMSPLDVEKRKSITKDILGHDDALIESPFHCDYGYNLVVGKNFYANHGCTVLDCNRITIGDNCMLAPHVVISAATHPLQAHRRAAGEELTAPITIGDNVWISANVTIVPNVTLGNGVVIGAGAVVTKSFPDNVVIAGVPAKIIRYINENDDDDRKSGELYDAFDPVLLAERNCAKHLCFQLNQTSPLDVDKRKSITKDILGCHDALIESPFHCDYGYNHLVVGKNFYANHGCTILDYNRITIGDNCMLAPHVVISTATHPLQAHRRVADELLSAPVTIGDNVWIGANVTIIPNVTLGNGVVIGAGAVVTKSFPDNVVIAGVPAKIVRYINEKDDDDRES